MFVNKLTVKNFLGITEAQLELGLFSALYGANGAGKSSIADAILHLCTGDVVRGSVVADVIRRGAKAAIVDGELANGRALTREVTRSGRELFIDGVLTSAKEAAVPLRETLQASPDALRAALRSGAILDLKPLDLQQLLVDLTGAAVDQRAIETALGESILAALARIKLPTPTSLGQLDTTADRAAKDRPAAKQKKKSAEDDLSHLPMLARDIVEEAARPEVTVASLELRRSEALRQRDNLLRAQAGADGARAERRREAVARLAEAEAIVARELPAAADSKRARAELDEAVRNVVRLQEAVAEIDREVLAIERQLGEATPDAPPTDVAREAFERARTALADASARTGELKRQGKELRAQVDRLSAGHTGTCPHCTQVIPAEFVATLQARLTKLRAEHDAAAEAEDAAQDSLDAAKLQLAFAEQREAQTKAQQSLEALKARRPGAVSSLESAIAHEKARRADFEAADVAARSFVEASKARSAAAAEAERLRQEIARIDAPSPAPSTMTIQDLDATIARILQVRDAIPVLEKRARYEKWIREADEEIEDRNAVEKACREAKVELLARAVSPFTTAANDALQVIAPGYEVEIHGSDGLSILARHHGLSLPIADLSDGERTRILYALQLAAVRLARVQLLILDRAELVDDEGRAAVVELAGTCADEGIQVLLLSCKPAPEEVDESVTAYVVEAGRARRIPTRRAEAA